MTTQTITAEQVEINAQLLWEFPEWTFHTQKEGRLTASNSVTVPMAWALNYYYEDYYQKELYQVVEATFTKMSELMDQDNPRWHFRECSEGKKYVWGHSFHDLAIKLINSKQFNQGQSTKAVQQAVAKVYQQWNNFDPLQSSELKIIPGFGRLPTVADRRDRIKTIICHWNSASIESNEKEHSLKPEDFQALRDGKKPNTWPKYLSLKEPKSYKIKPDERSLVSSTIEMVASLIWSNK